FKSTILSNSTSFLSKTPNSTIGSRISIGSSQIPIITIEDVAIESLLSPKGRQRNLIAALNCLAELGIVTIAEPSVLSPLFSFDFDMLTLVQEQEGWTSTISIAVLRLLIIANEI